MEEDCVHYEVSNKIFFPDSKKRQGKTAIVNYSFENDRNVNSSDIFMYREKLDKLEFHAWLFEEVIKLILISDYQVFVYLSR